MEIIVKTEETHGTDGEGWRAMEPAGGGGGSEEGTVTVVSPAQLFPVAQVSQVAVKMQLSPENSVDSTHSISVSHNSAIQEESTVLNSPSNSCDDGTTTTLQEADSPEPGHYITVTGAGPRSYTSLTTVPASEGGGDDVAHPYVQYIETGEQAIYTTTNGQMYPVYTVGESATIGYTASSGQYYAAGSTTPVTYTQVANSLTAPGTAGTQILGNTAYLIQQGVETEHGIITGTRASPQTVAADVAYLVPGGGGGNGTSQTSSTSSAGGGGKSEFSGSGGNGGGGAGGASVGTSDPASLGDPNAPNIAHATRVSPATVQWLLENYETAEGVSLPRSTLYNHYLRHCYENKLDPVNAASFGKLIRSVFLGLRTRRLGTRGNSKYHYYGIRVKAGSVLAQIGGEDDIIGRGYKRFRLGGSNASGGSLSSASVSASATIKEDPGVIGGGGSGGNGGGGGGGNSPAPLQEYLGDGTGAIPEFPEVDPPHGSQMPAMCSVDDLDTFRSIYRDHCEAFLDAIVNLEFATVETLWREFWRSQEHNNGDECEEEKYLSKTKLFMLSKFKPIQEFVRKVDFLFYQNLVQVLIPDVLRPIPSSLTQAIRNFAKGLESWLTSAMHGCPTEMIQVKVSAVSAFAQTLRRYTSLNHLAQAARAVLQNSVQINQMLADLNRVDFHNVQEQASWVCQCDASLVARLEADFKSTLQQQNSLEQWAAWLKAVVNTVLKPYQGRPNFTMAARQLLLKWSFYSSMVIRDLTLRSAASFGSFHLIRLLYDEYMFYLIEHQVALATGETPIAVMGEKGVLAGSPPPASNLAQQVDYELVNGQNGTSNNVVVEASGVPQQEIIIDIHQAKRLKMS